VRPGRRGARRARQAGRSGVEGMNPMASVHARKPRIRTAPGVKWAPRPIRRRPHGRGRRGADAPPGDCSDCTRRVAADDRCDRPLVLGYAEAGRRHDATPHRPSQRAGGRSALVGEPTDRAADGGPRGWPRA